MINGKVIDFSKNNIAYLLVGEVVVTKFNSEEIKYPLTEIKNIYTSQFNSAKILGLIVLIPIAALIGVVVWVKVVIGWGGH